MTPTKVEDLTEGQAVDLENDQYADPFGHRGEELHPEEGTSEADHMFYEDMYARVGEIEFENDGATVVVYFDQSTVGFPRGHVVMVDETVPADAE
jgi:hypothetical protein